MLRVGQMMWAEALKRHIFYKNFKENRITEQEKLAFRILKYFLDERKDLFSIQSISETAYKEYKLEPGKWFNPSNICYCLESIHNNQQRIEGAENLEMLICSESFLFLDEILKKFGVKEFCKCSLKDNNDENYQYIYEKDEDEIKNSNEISFHKVLSDLCDKKIQKKNSIIFM